MVSLFERRLQSSKVFLRKKECSAQPSTGIKPFCEEGIFPPSMAHAASRCVLIPLRRPYSRHLTQPHPTQPHPTHPRLTHPHPTHPYLTHPGQYMLTVLACEYDEYSHTDGLSGAFGFHKTSVSIAAVAVLRPCRCIAYVVHMYVCGSDCELHR